MKSTKKLNGADNRVPSSKVHNKHELKKTLELTALKERKKWERKNRKIAGKKENTRVTEKPLRTKASAGSSRKDLNNKKSNPTSDSNNTKSNPTNGADNTKSNSANATDNTKSNPTNGAKKKRTLTSDLDNTDIELRFLANNPKEISHKLFQWMIYPLHATESFLK